jgi:hypothetical protein
LKIKPINAEVNQLKTEVIEKSGTESVETNRASLRSDGSATQMPSNEELNKEKDKKQENPSIGVSETSTKEEMAKPDISQKSFEPEF